MKTIPTLLAIGLCTAVTLSSSPASALKEEAAQPTLRVSKKRVSTVCRNVDPSPAFKKTQRKAIEGKTLDRKQTSEIATEVCRFYAASEKQQARYWNASLTTLVKQGKLTKADRALLSKVLTNPEVLEVWKPTTEFGKLLLANAGEHSQGDNDATTQQSNSGAGWVVGGIIGGIAGGLMTGGNPAGIGAGIAVGGAAGSLAETVFSGDDGGGGTEEGGEGDDDGGDGGDAGGGDAGGGGAGGNG